MIEYFAQNKQLGNAYQTEARRRERSLAFQTIFISSYFW
jgi:hypothetical protein